MEQIRPFVVGFDSSADARRALDWAADAAERHRATLLVIVASGDPSYGGYSPLIVPGEVIVEEWAAEARDLLAAAGRPGRVSIVHDRLPQRALVDASSASTLVVVGARGHGRVTGAVLGSVSLPVTRHARGPVVVVRPAADDAALRVVAGVDGDGPARRRARDGVRAHRARRRRRRSPPELEHRRAGFRQPAPPARGDVPRRRRPLTHR
ncbi:hypothetical protein GCM10022242_28570 [Nocardioides panacisoli]|uniref:UspA domain-containing protein n=1 Tax=Nocardioides panacisoli TaxID=627624 RepID=A0ABP7ISY0_9ACTN